MARLCPSLPHRVALTLGDHAELDLLSTLERGLPAAYTLFHSVDWTVLAGDRERHGEIDIVVLNQAGDLLLLEVKSGFVDIGADGIFKRYGAETKDVAAQGRSQYNAMRSRLQQAQITVQVGHMLVMPHVKVQSGSLNWPRDRIIDSADMDQVVTRVSSALGPGVARGELHARVQAFLANRFQVEADVSALVGRLEHSVKRLSAGLATWVPRLAVPSGVIRVVGTAGSGKTQLALKLLREADAAGQRAAYLCFNRALADHMAQLAPVRIPAETFHEFALRLARRDGVAPAIYDGAGFQALADHCIATLATAAPDLDLIVLDEVQDMQPEWVEAVLGRLKAQGRAVLLEDPAQKLYTDRRSFEIAEAVTVSSNENFRSPRALVDLINGLHLADDEILAMSPLRGDFPEPIVYERPEAVAAATAKAVKRCLDRGFGLDDIAIVSLKGRDRSMLQGLDRLGDWSVRRFTGRFDAGGAAVWTHGQLLIDSVRRFKGQAAAAVVLTECDLPDLGDLNRRLLFVGLTRARMHLEWVVSGQFAVVLRQALSS
jgi:hypothetical protein